MTQKGPRINDAIRASQLRVVDEDGTMLGEMPKDRALELANEKGLDLVEVQSGDVPICRLQNYHRERFHVERQRRAAQQKNAARAHVAEVQLRPAISDHDLATKARIADRALAKGQRVQVSVLLHGRYITRPETAQHLLDRFAEFVEIPCTSESGASSERRVIRLLHPLQKGAPAPRDSRLREPKQKESATGNPD